MCGYGTWRDKIQFLLPDFGSFEIRGGYSSFCNKMPILYDGPKGHTPLSYSPTVYSTKRFIPRLSIHSSSTTCRNNLSGKPSTLLTRQPTHNLRYIIHRSQPIPGRCAFHLTLGNIFGNLLQHLALYRSWIHRTHRGPTFPAPPPSILSSLQSRLCWNSRPPSQHNHPVIPRKRCR